MALKISPGRWGKTTPKRLPAFGHLARIDYFSAKLHSKVCKIRNGQSTDGGPRGTKMDLFRPKWSILVHFGLANAKMRLGIRSFWPNRSLLGPYWSILVQYIFRQYLSHSLANWVRCARRGSEMSIFLAACWGALISVPDPCRIKFQKITDFHKYPL